MKKKLTKVLISLPFLSFLFLCSCTLLGTNETKVTEVKASAATVSEAKPTVYAVTLSTGFSVTGQKHSVSALFYQSPDSGTEWDFLGRPNNRIFNVAFFKPAKGKIIAMATHTGVQQSNDYGKTWKTTSGWEMTEVNDVAFDPNDSNTIYASSPYGFYKTVDGGKAWKQYNKGLVTPDQTFVSSILIDSTNSSRILITTEAGVYESNNAGEEWTKVKDVTIGNIRKIIQNPNNPEMFALCTENNGIYFSTDGGHIWAKSDVGILNNTFYDVYFDPNNPKIIYAAGFQTGVYKSIDGGKKWKQYFAGLGTVTIRSLAVVPGNSNIVYAGTLGKGVYVSTDEGITWKFDGLDNGFVSNVKIENF